LLNGKQLPACSAQQPTSLISDYSTSYLCG